MVIFRKEDKMETIFQEGMFKAQGHDRSNSIY
jgi:hypothetical protein